MTTEKQAAANKANAQKSTGPKTPEGKAVVAMNAVSHGILSRRLFLTGEDPAEFSSLQADLHKALRPVGALELALVEKIGVALWKQKRLVAAETAMLELGRHMRRGSNRDDVKRYMGLGYSDPDVTEADLEPLGDDDMERQKWCGRVFSEVSLLDDDLVATNNLAALAKVAPVTFEQLKDEAEEDGETPQAYIQGFEGELSGWLYELKRWCAGEVSRLARRPLVQSIAEMVQAEKSAPIANEVLMRYQIALDGELYRAMEALRKQQEWRQKSGIEVEAEVVVV